MTIDEMYNQIKDHFSKPDAVLSKSPPDRGGMCFYRLDRDPLSPVRCAVGCLIPDDKYNPDWEGLSVLDAMKESNMADVLGISVGDSNAVGFLLAAQRQHDNTTSTTSFLEGLENAYNSWRD
jgi:hypothetical protein